MTEAGHILQRHDSVRNTPFKDEVDGKIITNFIGLKPKSYAFKIYKQDKEEKKSKGIVKHKVKRELNYIISPVAFHRKLPQ